MCGWCGRCGRTDRHMCVGEKVVYINFCGLLVVGRVGCEVGVRLGVWYMVCGCALECVCVSGGCEGVWVCLCVCVGVSDFGLAELAELLYLCKKGENMQEQKAVSTRRGSQAVPDPSTNRALRRLTSEFGRDPVFSS